jgi:hypothetical protein
MTDTIDDGFCGDTQEDDGDDELMFDDESVPFGDFELGDDIELSVMSADNEGHLKFEFFKPPAGANGRIQQPFVLNEVAWRSLKVMAEEIDMCMMHGEQRFFHLSPDVYLLTCTTDGGDRLARLMRQQPNLVTKFNLTFEAWINLAESLKLIDRNADAHRRY